MLETAIEAHKKGLKNVLVTNGFINEEPLKELLPYIDAFNIDVKRFTLDYYHEICKGDLKPVLRSVELASKESHVEVTTLLVTGLNDSKQEVEELARWLSSVDKNIPLHLSRYFPNYQMEQEPTSLKTMNRAWEIAKKHLNYVYLGNVRDMDKMQTYCPQCNQVVIERLGYSTQAVGLKEDKCKYCDQKIAGVLV